MSISSTIGTDVYGFLNLLSKRQGPNDTTVPLPFAEDPPGPSVPPQAGMPVSPELPFSAPTPIASRRVQVAQAGPASANDASGPATPVAGPGEAVANPNQSLPNIAIPNVMAPATMDVPPLTVTPSTPSSSGGPPKAIPKPDVAGSYAPQDYTQGATNIKETILEQAKRARYDALLEGTGQSGMLLAGAITRDPSIRSMLSHGAGMIGGANGGGRGGPFSVQDLQTIREAEIGDAKEKDWQTRIAPTLSKKFKMPLDLIRAMKPESRDALMASIANGGNLEKLSRADGSSYLVDKVSGQTFEFESPDAFKVAEEQRKQAEAQQTAEAPPAQAAPEPDRPAADAAEEPPVKHVEPARDDVPNPTLDQVLQATELLTLSNFGSIPMLQRKMRIGFALATKIMYQLERTFGVVGPRPDGDGAREVLVEPGEDLEATLSFIRENWTD